MKTKQEFVETWGIHKGGQYDIGFAVTDALAVMEALEAQIPTAKFKVGDRVKCLQGYGGLDVRGTITAIRPEVEWAYWYSVDGSCEHSAEELELEPPTVEEVFAAYACGEPLKPLRDRYDTWKESQNA